MAEEIKNENIEPAAEQSAEPAAEKSPPAEDVSEKEVTADTAAEAVVTENAPPEAASGAEPAAVAEAESAEPVPAVPAKDRRWYIIFAKAGYENRVRKAIEERMNSTELGQLVFRVLVPEEEIIELRQNRRVERMKKMFPGYVFVEMILNEETWYKIRQIPGVSRFIGAHKMPVAVADKEMQRVLRQIGMKEETQIETDFEKGEGIRIISGPFRGYAGTIEECHPAKGKLRAYISIFGRDTPVELDFSQVERA